jgi:hypothetical protein
MEHRAVDRSITAFAVVSIGEVSLSNRFPARPVTARPC